MQAVVFERFGGPEVLGLREVPDPLPGRGEALVRVAAAALNPKDILVRKGKFALFTGKRFPMIPGYDVAGVVQGLGPGARRLCVGDRVCGMIQRISGGACAKLVAIPEQQLVPLPATLSLQEGAALPLVGLTALQALRDCARVRPGESLVINGASGGVGVHAIQIGKLLGAEVTAVCSERNASMVRDLGADEVAAYDKAHITASSRRFDAFFDVFGSAPYPKVKHLLAEGGRYVTAIPRPDTLARDIWARLSLGQARLVIVRSRSEDLQQLVRWAEEGKLRPVVDREFPLSSVADAYRYLETKRARGKVVLTLDADA